LAQYAHTLNINEPVARMNLWQVLSAARRPGA